jgi:hypothetical protein
VWIQDVIMGEQNTALSMLLRLDQVSRVVEIESNGSPPDFALFEAILRRAKADVAGWGGTLHFVYLPDLWFFRGAPPKDHPLRARVLATAHAVGLPVVDVHARFDQEPDLEALRDYPNAHVNRAGHAVLGRVINDYLDTLAR